MFILNAIINFIIKLFSNFGGLAAKKGCGGMMDEPEIPNELIRNIKK
ncbi:cyclic lactone autoinducer peptide AgrD [Staphylococcus pettenkoferi]|nr:cyclic lactone autoinducer peptide [Staphylococcus pettenkoferi]MCY1592578.1 cyclic lactone autoinducer peptide [Staphylococcus pettenkoferi]MCY1597987.1 cyclic lactone autoinducer peptide [Staphylococcus pettenkoferi]MCY1611608.1 cyclic lactone autoinducer peptide [Staphylococcus pettenkoferi]MCY1622098.1 cyclic lactone autoinducer peptide [Staphylococcus pettenkoferi]MCY1623730.1 cyclic lactone autoinducer peptide [Staphylococcus pettenkoferi]